MNMQSGSTALNFSEFQTFNQISLDFPVNKSSGIPGIFVLPAFMDFIPSCGQPYAS